MDRIKRDTERERRGGEKKTADKGKDPKGMNGFEYKWYRLSLSLHATPPPYFTWIYCIAIEYIMCYVSISIKKFEIIEGFVEKRFSIS